MSGRWWDLDTLTRTRDAHIRRARFAATMARDTDGATRRVWRNHAMQHVKAARREHWALVGQRRAMSAGLFLRKTIGAHMRARTH